MGFHSGIAVEIVGLQMAITLVVSEVGSCGWLVLKRHILHD